MAKFRDNSQTRVKYQIPRQFPGLEENVFFSDV